MSGNQIQQLLNEQRVLEEKMNELQNNIAIFQDTLGSYKAGLGVLEELATREVGETILINVGGAIFIEAQIATKDRVIRGIGSGVRTEQSLEDAKTILTERVEELNKFLGNLRQEFETTTNQAQMLANQAQQMLTQAQMAQAQAQQAAQQSKLEE